MLIFLVALGCPTSNDNSHSQTRSGEKQGSLDVLGCPSKEFSLSSVALTKEGVPVLLPKMIQT